MDLQHDMRHRVFVKHLYMSVTENQLSKELKKIDADEGLYNVYLVKRGTFDENKTINGFLSYETAEQVQKVISLLSGQTLGGLAKWPIEADVAYPRKSGRYSSDVPQGHAPAVPMQQAAPPPFDPKGTQPTYAVEAQFLPKVRSIGLPETPVPPFFPKAQSMVQPFPPMAWPTQPGYMPEPLGASKAPPWRSEPAIAPAVSKAEASPEGAHSKRRPSTKPELPKKRNTENQKEGDAYKKEEVADTPRHHDQAGEEEAPEEVAATYVSRLKEALEQETWDEDDEDFGDFMAKPVDHDLYTDVDERDEQDEAMKPVMGKREDNLTEKEALESPEQRGQAFQQEEPEEADKEATGGTPTSPHSEKLRRAGEATKKEMQERTRSQELQPDNEHKKRKKEPKREVKQRRTRSPIPSPTTTESQSRRSTSTSGRRSRSRRRQRSRRRRDSRCRRAKSAKRQKKDKKDHRRWVGEKVRCHLGDGGFCTDKLNMFHLSWTQPSQTKTIDFRGLVVFSQSWWGQILESNPKGKIKMTMLS